MTVNLLVILPAIPAAFVWGYAHRAIQERRRQARTGRPRTR